MGHIIGGRRANREGKSFEHLFDHWARLKGFFVLNIPMGCRMIGRNQYQPIKSPFDRTILKNGRAAFIDCKSINQKTFSYSLVKDHQIKQLLGAEEKGFPSGYLIYFRPLKRAHFIKASTIRQLAFHSRGLKPTDGIDVGDPYEELLLDNLIA